MNTWEKKRRREGRGSTEPVCEEAGEDHEGGGVVLDHEDVAHARDLRQRRGREHRRRLRTGLVVAEDVEAHSEGRAFAPAVALGADGAPDGPDQCLRDGQAQPQTCGGSGKRNISNNGEKRTEDEEEEAQRKS